MFLDEITRDLGISGTSKTNFAILNYGGQGVYIQGNLNILECSSVKITIKLSNFRYTITGENLIIKRLASDNLYINGKILDICKIS